MKNIAIKENHLYVKAYRRGERYVGRYLTVYVLKDYAAKRLCKENPQKQTVNRLGISVTKKIGGAVERNRAKRIIRAAYGTVKNDLRRGYLIVISAREQINGRKSTDLEEELRSAFGRLAMLDNGSRSEQKL